MTDPTPLTGEELAAIKARAGEAWRVSPLSDDVLRLVAEVERLRAQVRTLTDEVEDLSAIVTAQAGLLDP
jgi:uncharacterized protein YlxW (UPF0749 family)